MDKKMLKKRIDVLTEHFGVNNSGLAILLGTNPQNIYKLRKGELTLLPYIDKFVELGVNLHWLFTGDGEMLLKDISISLQAEFRKNNIRSQIEKLESFIEKIKEQL